MEHKDDNAKNRRMQRAMDDLEKEMQRQAEREEAKTRLREGMEKLKITASKKIVYSPPWVNLGPVPVIARGTLALIQGKAGAHKSRFAETIAELLLSDGKKDFLGFTRYKMATGYCICYVDTERSTVEDFPSAIQRIREGAGYGPQQDLPNFYPFSIKMEKRDDRLDAVKDIIEIVQDDMQDRGAGYMDLLIILDVITDCVRSFNNDSDANEFYDYVNRLCESYGVAFLLVIHENPGAEKARGHLGTEGLNKVNTQMQIGYEKNDGGEESDLIKLKFLKTRNAKKPEPIYFQFKDHNLAAADPGRVKEVLSDKAKAGNMELAAEALERIFSGKDDAINITKQDILTQLAAEAGISERTAERRVNDIISSGYILTDRQGRACNLIAQRATGKPTLYGLALASKITSEGPGDYSTDDIPF